MNEVEDELGEAVDNGYVTNEEIGVALPRPTVEPLAEARPKRRKRD